MIGLPYVGKIPDMSGIQVFDPEIILKFTQMFGIFVIKATEKAVNKKLQY